VFDGFSAIRGSTVMYEGIMTVITENKCRATVVSIVIPCRRNFFCVFNMRLMKAIAMARICR